MIVWDYLKAFIGPPNVVRLIRNFPLQYFDQIIYIYVVKKWFSNRNGNWLMFQPVPTYETNAIQMHLLMRSFWHLSQWSDFICCIFCNRLYSKDIHCEGVKNCRFWDDIVYGRPLIVLGRTAWRRRGMHTYIYKWKFHSKEFSNT